MRGIILGLSMAVYATFSALAGRREAGVHLINKIRKETFVPVKAVFGLNLELQDRHFATGTYVQVPLHFYNHTSQDTLLNALVSVYSPADSSNLVYFTRVNAFVKALSEEVRVVGVQLPVQEGEWTVDAVLQNEVLSQINPIVSSRSVWTFAPKVIPLLERLPLQIDTLEKELTRFAMRNRLNIVGKNHPGRFVTLLSSGGWKKIHTDSAYRKQIEDRLTGGSSVIVLDAGPGIPPAAEDEFYFMGNRIVFKKTPEQENHIQPSVYASLLWQHFDKQFDSIWNGYSGGVMVPAIKMEIEALNRASYLHYWKQKGADERLLTRGMYYAFELVGRYAFSTRKNDLAVKKALIEKVRKELPDSNRFICNAESIRIIQLHAVWKEIRKYTATQIVPLVSSGQALSKVSVYKISFGEGRGTLIISNLLTAGRLVPVFSASGLNEPHYDPVTVQFVLNLIAEVAR